MASYHFCLIILFSGIYAEDRDSEDNEEEIRISQSQPARIERYPSLVQVEFYNGWGSWQQKCAANIINEDHVLSAAQCFSGATIFERRIRAGSSIRNTGGIVIDVANVITHPDYGKLDYDSDISIVVLSSSLQYSSTIQPANIAGQRTYIPDEVDVMAAGWGALMQDGFPSEYLQEITIFTINIEECAKRHFEDFEGLPVVTENMICAGRLNLFDPDACPGDAGGGLFFGFDHLLFGLVSWKYICGVSYYPSVYTKIGAYRNWIESVVGNSSNRLDYYTFMNISE